MNIKNVIEELEKRYQGRTIVKNNEERPTEIVCEIEPTVEHPDYSIAIAVIDRSQEHYHKETTETYEVVRGELKVYKDGKEFILMSGESITINPGERHFAEGNGAWVKVTSKPGWKQEDHYLV